MIVLNPLDDFVWRDMLKYMEVELQMFAYDQHFQSRAAQFMLLGDGQ